MTTLNRSMRDDDPTGGRAVVRPPISTDPGDARDRFTVGQRPVVSGGGETVVIRPLAAGQHDSLFALFAEIVASGAGYPQAPPLTRRMFDTTWVTSVTLAWWPSSTTKWSAATT